MFFNLKIDTLKFRWAHLLIATKQWQYQNMSYRFGHNAKMWEVFKVKLHDTQVKASNLGKSVKKK